MQQHVMETDDLLKVSNKLYDAFRDTYSENKAIETDVNALVKIFKGRAKEELQLDWTPSRNTR